MKLVISFLLMFMTLCSALAQDHGGHDGSEPTAGKLQQGRYTGYLKINGRNEKIALQADLFIESPDDFTQFPKLESIVKLSLGGFHTNEYTAYSYKNLHYNFETGDLTLDEPASDLIFSAKVHSTDSRTYLQGQVWSRTSSVMGVFKLTSISDEPGDDDGTPDENDKLPWAPALDGQYSGKCGSKDGLFQIQTVKELRPRDSADGKEIFDYEVVARVGYRKDASNSNSPWELYGSYAGGSYDPYRGKLVFLGPSTTAIECSRSNNSLSCDYRVQSGKVHCDFERESANAHGSDVFPRKFHVTASAAQMQSLPDIGTISDAEMANLVSGHFNGYLHHEASDRYQRVALHVVASVSTENPHNPNKVFVSGTSVMYYGLSGEDLFISQRYEPRSFYIRPGFTLNAPGTDSFIQIDQWTQGFIRGVWYSQQFGRVGTVEFVKETPASISSQAVIVSSFQGEYRGQAVASDPQTSRWFNVILPNQPAERLTTTINFVGAYQSMSGMTPISPIERGTFDPYTGAIGFSYKLNEGLTVVSGVVANDGSLQMYWPPAPNAFGTILAPYRRIPFQHVQ